MNLPPFQGRKAYILTSHRPGAGSPRPENCVSLWSNSCQSVQSNWAWAIQRRYNIIFHGIRETIVIRASAVRLAMPTNYAHLALVWPGGMPLCRIEIPRRPSSMKRVDPVLVLPMPKCLQYTRSAASFALLQNNNSRTAVVSNRSSTGPNHFPAKPTFWFCHFKQKSSRIATNTA